VRPGCRRRPGPAHRRLLLRDRAMTTVVPEATSLERVFAELLAAVLHTDQVPLDSNFFDGLGADSLVMAQFCARVRRRGGLPTVSMKDVYAHPTIRSLAAAARDAAPVTHAWPRTIPEPPTRTRAGEYVLCGALQALFYLGYTYLGVLAA